MAKGSTMKASSLKHLLIFLIVVVLAGGIGGSVYAINIIKARTTEVVHSQIDARVSEGSAGHLNELQSYLDQNSGLIDFTSQYISGSNGTQSQDTIIATLSSIARTAGVSVQNFDFSSTAAPATTGTPTSSGLTFTVTIKTPLPYTSFLKFLQGIEKNAPRLQITTGTVSTNTQTASQVDVTPITMKVIQ